MRIAPAGGYRIHLDLGCDLHHRGLDAAGREKQPVQKFRAQGIAERRRQFCFRVALGDIGAHRGCLRKRRLAILQGRHLGHRIDGEIFGLLLRAGGNVGQHALVRLSGLLHQPERGERARARRPVELHHRTSPCFFHR